MGDIVTFYSYKGGAGRTMALANIAVLLAQWKYKVLAIDWDLEAPGLEGFFEKYVGSTKATSKKGIVDLLANAYASKSRKRLDWRNFFVTVRVPKTNDNLHLLTAGKRDSQYFTKLRKLDINTIYQETNDRNFVEILRNDWKQAYDFVLIDSRTGITDVGGICTIHLPDVLVLVFCTTDQSLNGAIDVSQKATKARQKLPIERLKLLSLPVPSRFDTTEEFKISQEWLDKFDSKLSDVYADWLPISVKAREILEITKIPYVPYFSFGEKLPVIEQGTSDPTSMGYAYENIAALIANRLESVEKLKDDRGQYISLASNHQIVIGIDNSVHPGPNIAATPPLDAYLDIETTGISHSDSQILLIGLLLVRGSDRKLVQITSNDITKKSLLTALQGVDNIFTYNGGRFDLPFIKTFLGVDLQEMYRHHDLMYDCWRNGFYGGLKSIEARLGITRKHKGISGLDVILLWNKYRNSQDETTLSSILQSNEEDLNGIKIMREKFALSGGSRMVEHFQCPACGKQGNSRQSVLAHFRQALSGWDAVWDKTMLHSRWASAHGLKVGEGGYVFNNEAIKKMLYDYFDELEAQGTNQ